MKNWRDNVHIVAIGAADSVINTVLEECRALHISMPKDDIRSLHDKIYRSVRSSLFSKFCPRTHMDL